jgi:hypothetical protein
MYLSKIHSMAKRTTKKPANLAADLGGPLSPEADQFLAEATAEFDTKQAALDRDWHFNDFKQWGFDQLSGTFRLEFDNGTEFQAEGQILGSYSDDDQSWEWAWHNPYVSDAVARDSREVKKLGERLGLSYATTGKIPVPGEEFISFLCAIGLKATGSLGIFRGTAGPIDVMILLKNPRTVKKAAKASRKKAA